MYEGENLKMKIIALDLDGTLTDSNKKITPKTKQALNHVAEQGIIIVLASGRPLLGITKLSEELELSKFGGYILAYNGGQIIDCKTGNVVYEKIIPIHLYSRICELAREHQVEPLAYKDGELFAESDKDVYVQKEAFNNSTSITVVDKLEKYIDKEVPKFMVVGDHEKLLALQKQMQSEFGDILNIFFSESYFLEILPEGIEKAKSLDILLDKLGLSSDELLAFGDGLNDIPMLEYAGIAVAMENAYEPVKEVADHITLSNDEDGILIFEEILQYHLHH